MHILSLVTVLDPDQQTTLEDKELILSPPFTITVACSLTISVSNRLDPDQARHFVSPDLGPNCLQKLSADDTSRQIVNPIP